MSELVTSMDRMNASVVEFQVTLVDRVTPAIREASFLIGRFGLEWYLMLPWYRRLWIDLRSGRFARNLWTGLVSWLP